MRALVATLLFVAACRGKSEPTTSQRAQQQQQPRRDERVQVQDARDSGGPAEDAVGAHFRLRRQGRPGRAE